MEVSWWLGTSFLVLLEKKENGFLDSDTRKIYCDKCGLSKCRNKSENINVCRFETTEM